MRTRLIFGVLAFSVAFGKTVAEAPPASRSARVLLQAILETVQAQSTLGALGFAASPQPVFRHDQLVLIDRDELDTQLQPLGFAKDHQPGALSVSGVPLTVQRWSAVKTCSKATESKAQRCTMQPNAVAVRFFDVAWIIPGVEIKLQVGTYHRSELSRASPGIGGKVVEYTFSFKNGRWTLAEIGQSFTS